MTLLLQQAKVAGEDGLIQDQDFAESGYGHGLKLGDGSENRELSCAEARRFKSEVVKAGHGPGSAPEVEGCTEASAM